MSKNFNDIKEFQIKFEKVCHENQEKTHLINKIRREWNRLKSDLNFLYITKMINTLHNTQFISNENDDINKEDFIGNINLITLI